MERAIEDITKEYAANLAAYKRRKEEIQEKLEILGEQEKTLERPWWVNDIIRPIAELMAKELPDRTYEILGPFGIGARTAIHFYKKNVEEKDRLEGDNCLDITFEPGKLEEGEILLVDYTVNLHRYAKGTVGEMNGLNHPAIPMKNTIKELVDFSRA